jgi:hypothetical protein
MQRIYESAFGAVIWLRESWDRLPIALTAIKKLAAASFAGRKAALAKGFGSYLNFEELTKAQNLPGKNSPELREFGILLQNPWFTRRAWVFQEVVASEFVDM